MDNERREQSVRGSVPPAALTRFESGPNSRRSDSVPGALRATQHSGLGDQHSLLVTHAWLRAAQRRYWLRRALAPLTASLTLAVGALVLTPPSIDAVTAVVGLPLHGLAATALLIAGLLGALALRPSLAQTARTADRELGLRERVTTAAELLERGRLDRLSVLQIDETAVLLTHISPRHAVPLTRAIHQVVGGAAALVAGAGALLLMGIGPMPALGADFGRPSIPGIGEVGLEPPPSGPPAPLPSAASRAAGDANARLAESRKQQEALNRLAEALGQTAAARDVADALRAGDTERAAARLEELARENDQLSPQAKKQLADALRSAAADQASGPLAPPERAAAAGLEGKEYRQAEQALRDLARAVRQAGQRQTAHEELARAFQNQQGQNQPSPGSAQPQRSAASTPNQPGQGNQSGDGRQPADGQPSQAQQGAGQGQSGNAPGAGSGADSGEYRPEESNTRLGVDGTPVDLDSGQPESGGKPPGEGAPPPVQTRPGTIASGESGGTSPGSNDPVQSTDTHRQVPVDSRGVVRDYFTPGAPRR